jgi:nucleotide-binding universal stress UspA family protein
MKIGKLLYATDTKKPSFTQLERLMVFRTLGLEEVVCLLPEEVEDWEKRLLDYNLKTRTLQRKGSLLPGILDIARQEGISIVAVCLKRGTKKVMAGSHVKNLIRLSPVPVIFLNEDFQIAASSMEKGIFHHVIFAADWSPASQNALEYLLKIKTALEMLEIVNVINKKLSVRDMRSLKERLVETRKIFLDKALDAEAHVYAGKPFEEIELAAKDYNATCLVLGSSYKFRLGLLGARSCACRLAMEANIATLVIPLSFSLYA